MRPDDVANQVVNCFASDFCAEDAKEYLLSGRGTRDRDVLTSTWTLT